MELNNNKKYITGVILAVSGLLLYAITNISFMLLINGIGLGLLISDWFKK